MLVETYDRLLNLAYITIFVKEHVFVERVYSERVDLQLLSLKLFEIGDSLECLVVSYFQQCFTIFDNMRMKLMLAPKYKDLRFNRDNIQKGLIVFYEGMTVFTTHSVNKGHHSLVVASVSKYFKDYELAFDFIHSKALMMGDE
ncbi:hypothetical protein FGO68_gene5311 [Halteria grandinella]|uniref:Uncharacterized protein n=1 Tax=Halteria grandinella TaxID=5974 RepID=A0A8J8NBT4_HALGN|nr:hypothetical protein FGO68_gene5311 [Halteria grandinella]